MTPGQELVLYADADGEPPEVGGGAAAGAAPWADAGRALIGGGPVALPGPSAHHLALPPSETDDWCE